MIRIDHVSKAYDGRSVLRDVSLEITSGDAYVITGPSGVGKTTLLRILLGLTMPDAGCVRLPEGCRSARLHAGVVFQEDRLCEDYSAIVNVSMVHRECTPQMARIALEQLLPADELDKPVRELSGGQRRRVAIVRACMVPSDILVMDEPFTGLDVETRLRVIRYIQKVRGERPLVLTAHDLTGLSFCKEITLIGE